VLAAIAHQQHVAVLHYDKDYEILGEHSGLSFESDWLAPRGTL
jgi:hypothetical protein